MNKLPFTIANNWDEFPKLRKDPKWLAANKNSGHIQFVATSWLSSWKLRMNNFPDEPCYTLIINGKEIIHFDNWPNFWERPQFPKW